jgi:hypothetical protein
MGFLVMGVLVGGLGVGVAQADSRLAVFGLECFGPWIPGYHTRATLVGQFQLVNRTLWTVASCADGPSEAVWPVVSEADGEVLQLEVTVFAVLENADGQYVTHNVCTGRSANGYLTLRCLADVAQGGEATILVSIPAP